ncbi:hypothetical protein BLAT2472_20781 [Burkholderia latens]
MSPSPFLPSSRVGRVKADARPRAGTARAGVRRSGAAFRAQRDLAVDRRDAAHFPRRLDRQMILVFAVDLAGQRHASGRRVAEHDDRRPFKALRPGQRLLNGARERAIGGAHRLLRRAGCGRRSLRCIRRGCIGAFVCERAHIHAGEQGDGQAAGYDDVSEFHDGFLGCLVSYRQARVFRPARRRVGRAAVYANRDRCSQHTVTCGRAP